MQAHGIRNSVWITTDIHFAEAFRYVPFASDTQFVVHEVATGPLNAGIFPTAQFDVTLNPEKLFGPAPAAPVASWSAAKAAFNFGELEVSSGGVLTMRIVNTAGATLFERTLTP